jgi:4'-phosphopantetheinyl transferase
MNERSSYPIQSFAFTPSAPQQLEWQGGTVELWVAECAEDAAQLRPLEATLSHDEQARAQRFRFARDRAQFIHARGTLRIRLARALNVAPATLQFGYEANGKPYLRTATGARSSLRFNVSHTNGLAMYALAWHCEVGLDVEQVRAELADETTARHIFTPDESSAWQRLPDALQPAAFFHTWTCKEAYLKTLGAGLSLAPETIAVTLNDEALPRWIKLPTPPAAWAFYHFVPRPGFVAALGLLSTSD